MTARQTRREMLSIEQNRRRFNRALGAVEDHQAHVIAMSTPAAPPAEVDACGLTMEERTALFHANRQRLGRGEAIEQRWPKGLDSHL